MTGHTLTAAARRDALSRCAVFARIPGEALGVLAEMMDSESLRAGDTLFARGEPSERVYLVVQGQLSVFLEEGGQAVRRLGPGELLGEYGMFAGHTRTATVRAHEEAVMLSLGYERFRAFLLQFPEASLALLATSVRRLVEAERS